MKRIPYIRSLTTNVEELNRFFNDTEPFFKFLGAQVVEIRPGYSKLVFQFKEELSRAGGVLHGGVIMSVLDYTCGIATMTVNSGDDQVTQELKVNFLQPMYSSPFTVEGEVIRAGRTAVVVRGTILDKEGNVGAVSLGTWYIIRGKSVQPE